jgi:hypothetical protein
MMYYLILLQAYEVPQNHESNTFIFQSAGATTVWNSMFGVFIITYRIHKHRCCWCFYLTVISLKFQPDLVLLPSFKAHWRKHSNTAGSFTKAETSIMSTIFNTQ